MKFTAALLFAGAVQAAVSNVTYTTEIVKQVVTYCPAPTHIPIGPGKTITVTAPGTITITDCPCTVTKPVIVTPIVECKTCNGTKPTVPGAPPATTPIPTGGLKPSPPPVVAGAAKLSGAGLAAVLGAAILL